MSDKSRSTEGSSVIYGLGIFGALFYYWQTAEGFWMHVYALFQALLWPAYMVFEVLDALRA